jgi:sugar phosphate isomerase/epimerase
MLIPGLTSITFRKLSCAEVIGLAKSAGLAAIEWGGDVHVPHGDTARAAEVAAMTADAGLVTCSYGSYYRCGMEESGVGFEKIIETTLALKAPLIRVWAGKIGSRESSPEQRKAVMDDIRRIAVLAARPGIKICLEFHRNTLNDDPGETLKLMEESASPNLGTYWQPPIGMASGEACAGLSILLPFLQNVHVFHWGGQPARRMLLAEGVKEWRDYFRIAGQSPGDHHALLEFVQDDKPAAFLDDARALIRLVTREKFNNS